MRFFINWTIINVFFYADHFPADLLHESRSDPALPKTDFSQK